MNDQFLGDHWLSWNGINSSILTLKYCVVWKCKFWTEMLQKNNIKNSYLLHFRRLYRITEWSGFRGTFMII